MTRKLSELPSVATFRSVAQRYVEFVADYRAYEKVDFLEEAERQLARLISSVLELPRVQRPGPDPPELDHMAARKPLFFGLEDYLGEHGIYWSVFDPTKPPDEPPSAGSLADDLVDIYVDLQRGLEFWDDSATATRNHIVWEWRFSYESHWGHHASDALRVVHELLLCTNLGRAADRD